MCRETVDSEVGQYIVRVFNSKFSLRLMGTRTSFIIIFNYIIIIIFIEDCAQLVDIIRSVRGL